MYFPHINEISIEQKPISIISYFPLSFINSAMTTFLLKHCSVVGISQLQEVSTEMDCNGFFIIQISITLKYFMKCEVYCSPKTVKPRQHICSL